MIAVFHTKFISSILNTFGLDLPYLNVQINLSLTSSLTRPPQLLSIFEVKTIHDGRLLGLFLPQLRKFNFWLSEHYFIFQMKQDIKTS